MKTTNKMTGKKIYSIPLIERILLDNEISLALESAPPVGPDEGRLMTPEHYNNNPFDKNLA